MQLENTKEDAVLVTNNTDRVQTISIYPTDAVITNTGAFSCEQKVEDLDGVGSWIKLAKSEVTLQPGTDREVPFIITMPSRVDVGEYNGCLAFEPKGDEGEVEGNVRIRTRSAVRVAVTVPGDLKKQVDITDFSVTSKQGGRQDYTLSLENTGNVSADTTSIIALKSLAGTDLYSNKGTYPVLADSTYDVIFSNDALPFWGGWYRISASISYDKAAGSLGNAVSSDMVKKYAKDKYVFISPAPLATAIYFGMLAIILTCVLYLWIRQRDKNNALKSWQQHTVKQGETIQSLAESRGESWQKLAKVNSIKAPYVLVEGTKIRIPRKN
ncbi:MAG: hypothetical protein UY35_C0001G0127 [Candidatus Saccharibacteria bacterium GW2011_GWC2_48_9]|nr:MAG: hypothetical protein UY35_C0001G0127 [Candidatus Saccharibacteria bacterium GW2011_GWC2_48_9]